MAHIEKIQLESGIRYRARWRDPDGKTQSQTFKRKTDADKHVRGVDAALFTGTYTNPKDARVLVSSWLERHQASWLNLSEATKVQRETLLRRHVLPRFGQRKLGSVSQLEVQGWVNDLAGSGLAPSTVRQAYACLARAFRAAVTAQQIQRNPCREIVLPRDVGREMHFLNPVEIEQLADAIAPEFRTLVLTAAYTGLRWGELVGLKRGRVHVDEDLELNFVQVVEQMTEVRGRFEFKQPKTRQSRRRVRVPAGVAAELREHLATRPPQPDSLIFVGRDGAALRRSNFSRRFWKPAVRGAKLPSDFRFHDLRHTCAALLIARNAHPRAIMEWLGHSKVETTLGRYGHLFPEQQDRLVVELDAVRRAASQAASDRGHESERAVLPFRKTAL